MDLNPPILPGEGLLHAMEWLATRMREQYGLPVELQANGPFVISNEDMHVLLFNSLRELSFNMDICTPKKCKNHSKMHKTDVLEELEYEHLESQR